MKSLHKYYICAFFGTKIFFAPVLNFKKYLKRFRKMPAYSIQELTLFIQKNAVQENPVIQPVPRY